MNSGNSLLNDPFTGFHIRAGEYIISNLSVPRYDIFSFIAPPLPWVAHEWLSEVIMAVIHQTFGLTGIVLFFSFFIALTYSLLFKFVQSIHGNIVVCCVVVILVAASSMVHWLARPHIFTLTLTVLWYYVLDAYQYKNKNYLYLLPPIMLLWVNLHGGFIIGFVLLAIYICGDAIEALFALPPEQSAGKTKFIALSATAFICLLISVINPFGYHLLLFPFKFVSDQPLSDLTIEFMSPNFHDALPFKYLLLLTIAGLAISRTRANFIEVSLALLFSYMALYSIRHIPLFAIVVAPILVRHLNLSARTADTGFIHHLDVRANNLASLDAQLKGHLWPICLCLLVYVLAARGNIQFRFDENIMPVAAVNFLKSEHIKGNMFNHGQYGDYTIYDAWPRYKVFMDGRTDMYGGDRLKEYLNVMMGQPGWQQILAKYDINFVFFTANSSISTILRESKDWRLVYADKAANIFVRNTPENRDIKCKC